MYYSNTKYLFKNMNKLTVKSIVRKDLVNIFETLILGSFSTELASTLVVVVNRLSAEIYLASLLAYTTGLSPRKADVSQNKTY